MLGAALSLNTVINELIVRASKSKSFDVLTSHIKKVYFVQLFSRGHKCHNVLMAFGID